MKKRTVKVDPHFNKARKIVLSSGNTSISYLQRTLGIGYMRAAEIMEQLEWMDAIGDSYRAEKSRS